MIQNIKKIWMECLEHKLFLLLLLLQDFMFAFLLWLIDARAFYVLAGMFAAAFFSIFVAAAGLTARREDRRRKFVAEFLEHPESGRADSLLRGLPFREREQLQEIGVRLRENEAMLQEERLMRREYEEYVEVWVHEIKVPLSLMSLVLDNRREEMSSLVYRRLVHAGNRISEYVTQILYYSRLKSSHRDLYFERLFLAECLEEITEKYGMVLMEEGIQAELHIDDAQVVTDRKGVLFILEQAISNACKYQDDGKQEKWLKISCGVNDMGDKVYLSIRDNGIGVKPEDLPFLFDRGFTGDTDERKRKATGMGLYLAGQMAHQLNVELTAASEYGQFFELRIEFPLIELKTGGSNDIKCKSENRHS